MSGEGELWTSWMRETMLGYLSTARASGKEIPLTVLSVDAARMGKWHHIVDVGSDASVIRAVVGKVLEQASCVRYGVLVMFEVSTGGSDGTTQKRDVAVSVTCDEWTAEAVAYEFEGPNVVPSARFPTKALEGVATQFAGLVGPEPANVTPS